MKKTTLTLTLVLLLLLLCCCKSNNAADKSSKEIDTDPVTICVYLEDGLSSDSAKSVQKELEQLPNIRSIEFYSKEQALEEFRESLGEDVMEKLNNDNPLPDIYKVTLNDLSMYSETVEMIEEIDAVEAVSAKPIQ